MIQKKKIIIIFILKLNKPMMIIILKIIKIVKCLMKIIIIISYQLKLKAIKVIIKIII